MYKGSEDYVRVAEPFSYIKSQKISFKFEDSQNTEIFGITKKEGIIYIKNAQLLKDINQAQIT